MKKIKAIAVPLLAAMTLLSGCATNKVNQFPEITGVADITCMTGATVDLLGSVAALDKEDGDITADIEITVIPYIEVVGGYAVFDRAGKYEIIYEVADSNDNLFRSTAYATVSDREVYRDDILTNGFSLKTGGGVKVAKEGLTDGKYNFSLSGGEIYEDVRLTREYDLATGAEYSFSYYFNSNLSGKIKAVANGSIVAETYVLQGDNTFTFEFATESANTTEKAVDVELWLGALEGDLEFSLMGARTERRADDNTYTAVDKFNFAGNYEGRFDQTEGNAYTVQDGAGVCVEITSASADSWRGGVFVNTGISLVNGSVYTVSFDVSAENSNPYEVCFQNSKWDEVMIETLSPSSDGRYTVTLADINDGNNGTLWLYVRSGNYLNKITLSDLTVEVTESGVREESYYVNNFTTSNYNGGEGSVSVDYGTVVYNIQSFGTDWGNNEINSPAFELTGAAENYVITFKASASSPVSCVFAASVAQEWNTFVWENFTIPTEETTFSMRCNTASLEGMYKFIWQFGSSQNAGYSNVTITISEIKICYKSNLEN